VVEHRSQRRLLKEGDPGNKAGFWEQPDRADIQNDTATKGKSYKLDEDEGRNLWNSQIECYIG
jgi:hypothetical protein